MSDKNHKLVYLKKWRAANPEKVAAYAKKWREANPDKLRARNTRYRAANLEAIRKAVRDRNRAAYHADLELARQKVRENVAHWRAANPDRNREIQRAANARQRAKKLSEQK